MKKLTAILMGLVMGLGVMAVPVMAEEAPAQAEEEMEYEDVFAEWNEEAPALNALIDYVEAVTDETSPDYIPPVDRIAVFDMDGTLMGELYPTYLEYYMLAWRILKDPRIEPDAEMLEVGRTLRDCALDNSFPSDMPMQHAIQAARAYAGLTLNEFADFVTEILVRDVDGFEGMTYGECFYLPMVEVVEYLQDNDFKVYVCSGSDRFICRTFIEGMLDIPYENVIGMDVQLEATGQGDTEGLDYVFTLEDDVIRTDRLLIKNLKTNKVLQIAQEIGRQPVLSFGNSSGDVSMHNYTITNNTYRSAAFMLIADDDVRDYGNPEKAEGLREKWEAAGYNVISMRDDFRTIYGHDVVKTGTFRWMEELAEERVPAEASAEDEDAVYAEDEEEAADEEAAAATEISTTTGNDDVMLSDDASDFVLLSEAVPDAILEIRYYSTYNFVGERIDGYEEPLAFLTKEAAAALKEVSDELVEKGYRLKIFDAYRPQKAVNHFMDWALDMDDIRMKEYFYPELEKDVLFPQGYIAEHSGHSRGSTVDLTLFDMTAEKEVDMGGTFDYFGELSHPDYTDITEEQYANRMILREAMMAHGFKPLVEEWWHFTLEDEPYPDTYFTFPVNSDSVEPEAAAEAIPAEEVPAEEVSLGTLLVDLVNAYENPAPDDLQKIDADAEALQDEVAASVAEQWKKVYLDPEYELLLDGTDDPTMLEIPDDSAHAFVILGYELENGEMTDELKGRCNAAASAAQAFPDSILVCTGGATGKNNPENHTEAGLMKDYLSNECGIDPERIFTDERAMTTAENALNTYVILKEQDIQTMTIITSSYHQRWGQVLYCAVGEQYNQESGYSAEIIGNYCYDVEPSVPMYEMDDRIAAWQLAMILGMPEEEIRRLAENELAFR